MIIKKISWSNAQYLTDNLTHYKIKHQITIDSAGRCVLKVGSVPPGQLEKMPPYIKKLLKELKTGGPQQ